MSLKLRIFNLINSDFTSQKRKKIHTQKKMNNIIVHNSSGVSLTKSRWASIMASMYESNEGFNTTTITRRTTPLKSLHVPKFQHKFMKCLTLLATFYNKWLSKSYHHFMIATHKKSDKCKRTQQKRTKSKHRNQHQSNKNVSTFGKCTFRCFVWPFFFAVLFFASKLYSRAI